MTFHNLINTEKTTEEKWRKSRGGLPVSLWDTYSSFANCYGGVIILGVKENKDGSWRTTGLQNASKLGKNFGII